MPLTLTDIREGGLLELYALGELSPDVRAEVSAALRQHADLREELREVERDFQRAAFAGAIPAEERVLRSTLATIGAGGAAFAKTGTDAHGPGAGRRPRKGGSASLLTYGLAALAALGLGVAVYLYAAKSELEAEATQQALLIEECAEREAANAEAIALLEDLRRPDNRVVDLAPTERYPEATLLLYVNAATERNYLAVAELPPLSPGEAYQLWSLKPDQDPIPLDVFDAEEGIFPVSFEAGTGTYAITIEDVGGAQVPNLDQLVGTMEVG